MARFTRPLAIFLYIMAAFAALDWIAAMVMFGWPQLITYWGYYGDLHGVV